MFRKLIKLKIKHQVLFLIIITFAVISFWRGVWGLMDEYLLPNNMQLSYVASIFIGVIILIITGYATKELM